MQVPSALTHAGGTDISQTSHQLYPARGHRPGVHLKTKKGLNLEGLREHGDLPPALDDLPTLSTPALFLPGAYRWQSQLLGKGQRGPSFQ